MGITDIKEKIKRTRRTDKNVDEKSESRSLNKSADLLNTAQLPNDTIRYTPDIKTGLTDEQITQRNEAGLKNVSNTAKSKSYGRILYENIVTYFNLLLLFLAVVLIVFKQHMQLSFLIIAIANTLIGIIQAIKAKKTIDKLQLITSSEITVIRNEKKQSIKTEELVLDDIFIINIGDQIPADAIIKEGKLEVNESLLSGESLPMPKHVGDKIYAGSFVVSGSATCQADLIGDYNYVSGIQAKARELTKPKSELVRSLNAVIKLIGIIIIPLGALTFWTQWMAYFTPDRDPFLIAGDTVKAMAASMVGMIPSGMYLLTSVALAGSIISLSKQHALVQDLYSVEMLARVNVLCLDKTGTLTDGTMRVDDVIQIDESYDLAKLIGTYINSFAESNPTSIALSQKYPLCQHYQTIKQIPFSSTRKFSAVEFLSKGTFVLGAPEVILKRIDKKLTEYISNRQLNGYRIVMLAHSNDSIQGDEIPKNMEPVAVFALEDHIREEAPKTIKWFIENGVGIKIISGDNPLTASEIALKCGVPDAQKCISLEGLNEPQIRDIINDYVVFGRVTPEQKAIIIEELKNQGKTVGMTGDGVNDILAMKKADCSVAMANGSSAARNAANLVLLDSNFASMPAAVRQGRRAINNVQRSSSLYLMKTIFTIVFTIIVLITYLNGGKGIKYPFDPNNLLVTEMICIGFVSIFLSIQQNDAPITGHFLTNTFIRAVPAAFCLILAISLNYIFRYTGNFLDLEILPDGSLTETSELAFRTLNSMSMTCVGLGMAYNCCLPVFPLHDKQNRYRFIGLVITFIFVGIMIFGFGSIPGSNASHLSLSHQIVGIDYKSLNKTMWLLLIIYLTGLTSFLGLLVRFAESSTIAHNLKQLSSLQKIDK